MKKPLKHEAVLDIDSSVDHLWAVLTDSKFTQEYMFNCSVTSDWTVGSSIVWEGNFQGYQAYQKGEIIEINPMTFVKYSTFDPNSGLEDVPESYVHVSYSLQQMNGKVQLTIVNETFDGSDERIKHVADGWGLVLNKLKEVAEDKSAVIQA